MSASRPLQKFGSQFSPSRWRPHSIDRVHKFPPADHGVPIIFEELMNFHWLIRPAPEPFGFVGVTHFPERAELGGHVIDWR